VIDLRNDPGGLNQAIAVSGDFLNGGEVVSTRGRRQADTQRYEAHGATSRRQTDRRSHQ
jgi:carboxyl-terminal processing protease